MNKPMLSFVIPCYRSEHTIGAVVKELTDTLSTRPEYEYEIVLVNDGSPDNTAGALEALARQTPRVVFVDLSRNFGQHSALMAGFHQVKGDIVICLDDDGQTPACECFKLIDKVEEGYDIVFAEYPERRQNWFRNLGSRFNAACNHFFFGQPRELKANSYYACRRFVVDAALQYPNPFPYVTGLLFQSVSRYCNVPVNHRARMEGRSGYSLKKLVGLWFNGCNVLFHQAPAVCHLFRLLRGGLRVRLRAGDHHPQADEPGDAGGLGQHHFPDPAHGRGSSCCSSGW